MSSLPIAVLQRNLPLVQELLAHTKAEGDCLVWAGSRNSSNYGLVRIEGRLRAPHRVVYELTHNVSLNSSEHVLHSCDNPPCVNPRHLSVGSASDNMRDMVRKGRGGRAKLTPEQVADIRARYFVNGRGRHAKGNGADLAAEFGVHIATIRLVASGRRTWQVAA